MASVKRTIQVFKSFADAEKADKAYYRSLTPNQRLEMLLELIDQNAPRTPDGSREEFKQVIRVVKRTHLKESD